MKEVPILVVGGGTAGTMLTLELARRGVKHLTDRPAPEAVRNLARDHDARAHLRDHRADRQAAHRALSRARHSQQGLRAALRRRERQAQRSASRPRLHDARFALSDYLLVHRQSETEQYLREYTSAHFGTTIEWGTQCLDVKQDANGVTATLETDGKQREVRCRYLVACDGINSRVRRSLGLEQQESDYSGTVLQNMDAYLEDFPDVDDYVHYCAGTDHFIMIVKLPGGFYRMLLSDRGEAAGPDVTPEQGFMRLVNKHFDGVTLGDVVWHSKWSSYVRLAHTYRLRQRLPRGRLGARALDDGRAGHELLPAGLLQPRLEARARDAGPRAAGAARHLRDGAPADRRAGDLGRIVAARDLHGPRQGHRRARAEDQGSRCFSTRSSGAARASRTPIAITCRRAKDSRRWRGRRTATARRTPISAAARRSTTSRGIRNSRCSCSPRTTTTRARAPRCCGRSRSKYPRRARGARRAAVAGRREALRRVDARPAVPAAARRLRRLQVPRDGSRQARVVPRASVHPAERRRHVADQASAAVGRGVRRRLRPRT